jgi:hypothetical protein
VNWRQRTLILTDRLLTAAVVALVFGSAACFGGAVWWFRPVVAGLVFLMVSAKLVQLLLKGPMPILKSPLAALAVLALTLGLLQLVPLPARLASVVSPGARAIYSTGTIPALAQADLSSVRLDDANDGRSPATLDRAATLRWLIAATTYLGIFWGVTHFTDRPGRLYLVWGSIVGAFVLNGALGVVQITCHSDGLYGYLLPGRSPIWAPSEDDMLQAPSIALLRRLGVSSADAGTAPILEKVALVPERPFLFGTMMGGPGAFLALGALALPLAMAMVLHVVSPRGSRESLSYRLQHSGQGGLAVLLVVMLLVCTFLIGILAGPRFCGWFALGLAAVGLPHGAGSRGLSIGLMVVLFSCLGLGAVFGDSWPRIVGGRPPIASISWASTERLWRESLPILRSFPIVGTGLGSFPTIYPYMKTHDASSTTAMSSVLQCGVESGTVGLGILAVAAIWSLCRLPGCIRRVGPAERTLAYGLVGSALGFAGWSLVHWTVELPAVAISASALLGTCNRWLAGGTDLFVERG